MMPPSLPPELFATLSPAVEAYIHYLGATVTSLTGQIATLTARVVELEAKLNQNSSNSHRPPWSDGPRVKPAPPKIPGGKNRGGQSGHPKHDRVLLPADETHDRKPARCRRCCTRLVGDDPDPVKRQAVGDGDPKDTDLCPYPVKLSEKLSIAKCMNMISPADVIRRIEMYYEGGALKYQGD